MITLEAAYKIASKKYKDFTIISCVDTGDRFVFSFGIDKNSIPPGVPMVSVSKANANVGYLTIPPFENIELLEKGKEIL